MCDGKLLFVYGTLKSGGRLNKHMLDIGGIRVRTRELLVGYRMVNTGWFPAITETEDATSVVQGELWAIPNKGFEKLDFVEGVSTGLFRRETHLFFDMYVSDKFDHIDSPELINQEGYYEWPV